MVKVCGVRFKEVGKVYHFSPAGNELKNGDKVIVETSRGIEFGEVVIEHKEIDEKNMSSPLKNVIRKATDSDCVTLEENKKKEAQATEVFNEKVKKHKLEMKLVNVEYTFDRGKLLFYFTAEGRVDFRELVKDLASVFKTRIELRQIGVRDEAKILGGLGICGQPFCCATHLDEFRPVSIKMAKEQGLSLNPTKISGTCGRLMCCLKYEQEAYEDLLRKTPKVGAIVDTAAGRGTVIDVDILRGILKVSINGQQDAVPKQYSVKDVKLIKDSTIKVDKSELEKLKELQD